MTKIKSRITKIISSILGFFGIMTFTSCYGMPPTVMYGMGPNYNAAFGTVQGDVDGDGKLENVPGIRVVLKSALSDSRTSSKPDSNVSNDVLPYSILMQTDTDENGRYDIFVSDVLQGDYIIEFIDVDGAENGEFENESKTVTFSGEDYEEKEVDIELKSKKNSE